MLWEVLFLIILLLLQVLCSHSFDLIFIGPMCLRKYPFLDFPIFWNKSFQNIFWKSLNFDLILLILVFSMFLVILAKGLSVFWLFIYCEQTLWCWVLSVSSSLSSSLIIISCHLFNFGLSCYLFSVTFGYIMRLFKISYIFTVNSYI